MRKPPDTCEAWEVFDFQENPSSLLQIRRIFVRVLTSNLEPVKGAVVRPLGITLSQRHVRVHNRSTGSPLHYQTIDIPIQRKGAGKAALPVYSMKRRDFSANTYFSCMVSVILSLWQLIR